MKRTRRLIATTASAVVMSLLVANAPLSAATDTGTQTIPSTIKVSSRHSLNTDKVIASALGISVQQLRSEIKGGSTLAEIAASHGSSADAIATLVKSKLSALVSKAVKSGSIARGKAASVRTTLGATVSGLMNRAVSTSRHGDQSELNLLSDSVVADLFGITVTQLRTELETGISILAAATNHGITADALIAALTTDANAKITAAIASGAITQERGDELIAGLPTRIDSYINRIGPSKGRKSNRKQAKALKLSDDRIVARIIGITEDQLETEHEAGNSYATIAAKYSVTVDTLKAGITTEAQARIANALASGRITDTQATAYLTSLPTWVDTFVNRVPTPDSDRVEHFHLVSLNAAATFIGMTRDALKQQLRTGITVGQVALNNGKTIDNLSAALVADSTTRIATEVAAGRMTQSTANILLANLSVSVDRFINQMHD
jgi:hypothetical protein